MSDLQQLSPRELDAAIAVALGWTVQTKNYEGEIIVWTTLAGERWSSTAAFSADGNAILELIGEMGALGYGLCIQQPSLLSPHPGIAIFTKGIFPPSPNTAGDGCCAAGLLTHRVARAALAALLAEKEKGE